MVNVNCPMSTFMLCLLFSIFSVDIKTFNMKQKQKKKLFNIVVHSLLIRNEKKMDRLKNIYKKKNISSNGNVHRIGKGLKNVLYLYGMH